MENLFETERLTIRPFDLNDAAFVLTLLNTPAWLQYIGDRGVNTLEGARQYLVNGALKSYEENRYGGWLVALKENGQPIGMCGLFKRDYLAQPDLGFAFLPGYEGKGYAYEATMATLAYVKQHFDFNELYAITQAANSRSVRLLERSGFTFTSMIKPPNEDKEVNLFTLDLIA